MGVFDFLFGKPEQTGQLDPQTKAARDFLLDQMLQQYSAGPVNMPTYQAVAPSGMYSGTNSLLASLGLEGVEAPSLPTTTVGGMEVYTSEPFQTQMETAYAETNPGQYDYLRSFYMDPVTGELGSRSYAYNAPQVSRQTSGGGGGGSSNYTGGGGGGAVQVSGPPIGGRATYAPPTAPRSQAESSFGSDLTRSLTDSSYDPPGTVVSRALDRVTGMFARG